jgi:hypothetical protein
MVSGPKPGDPDFVQRHPPLDLDPLHQRVTERRKTAAEMRGPNREIVEGDTDILARLLLEVRNLRIANACLKDVIDAMQTHRRLLRAPLQNAD